LKFSTTKLRDLAFKDLFELQYPAHFVLVVTLELRVEHLGHGELALDHPGDLIDILGLDQRFDVVFEDFCKVVLKLGAAEVLENLFPVRGVLRIR
jgi:hypothetical protein